MVPGHEHVPRMSVSEERYYNYYKDILMPQLPEVTTQYYLSHWELSKGLALMAADKWLVQDVTSLQEGSFRVTYTRTRLTAIGN